MKVFLFETPVIKSHNICRFICHCIEKLPLSIAREASSARFECESLRNHKHKMRKLFVLSKSFPLKTHESTQYMLESVEMLYHAGCCLVAQKVLCVRQDIDIVENMVMS
jgi:hypothetical protein